MPTIPEALAIALRHHRAGRLQAAEQIYRQIVLLEPNHADAIHLLGLIANQAGKLDDAVACYRRALELKPDYAEAHGNLGNTLKKQGKLDEAIACYRRALELKPNYAEAHNNLGNALKNQGKLDDARASFRRALELNPDFAPAHNNLGNTLKNLGKLDEAVASYHRALELKADFAEAHNNLGVALKEQGKLDEAVACYRQALKLKPDVAEAHDNLGNVLKDQGKLDEAVASYRRALDLKADFAEAHNNLGLALKNQGRLDEAVACYRRAVELQPDYVLAHNNLGVVLQEQGKLAESLACSRRALELQPDYAEAHGNVGNALKEQGKLDEALAAYRRALELKPDFAEVHGNVGSVLEEMGDLPGAEDCFRAALRHNSRFASAHCQLAMLLGGKLPENDLAALRQLLELGSAAGGQARLTDADRLSVYFGLARVLDARGEYAEAAEHLDRGNALQRADWRKRGREYDPQAYAALVNRMMAVCTPDFFQRVRGFSLGDHESGACGMESEVPVFVVGLPRSGTTLVEQILASHSRVFGAGEIPLVPDTMDALGEQGIDPIEGLRRLDRATAGRLAARHLERLRAYSPTALRIVDKMPENYLYLGLLASLFPRAKLIHCRRDLRDVAVSCWMTHFQAVRWANDQEHIASRFLEYRRLMEHWRKVLPIGLLEVDYEETVADLEGVARRLVAWCGLEWEPRCLDFQRARRPVSTASAVQVRQPVFRTSLDRWKHYQDALGPLFARLEMDSSRDDAQM